ncbi:carbonic anhydrase [Paenibacillus sp. JX-17]|uniref:carbonic anhydrase n=1 Tax=Paenibacillus lacisoli TaxID=3064525 RepID=A0ABT9CBH7_9BACL|nr:carbonic anhydrase [Paenibacillus sp. JX-17]MDO7904963.1 carbonic anhydrase [Paenibacillus sp. JX-17]
MNHIEEILEHNRQFVESKEYVKYQNGKSPRKKMVIVTCMDTRLVELLPKAMNLRNGDVKIIKTAGAIVSQPFGSVMRSIMVALYELGAEEVLVVGHYDCGMASLDSEKMIGHILERGVSQEVLNTIENIGIKLPKWLKGFDNVSDGVINTVEMIRSHPLFPPNAPVHGMIIDPDTGRLDQVVNGYERQ